MTQSIKVAVIEEEAHCRRRAWYILRLLVKPVQTSAGLTHDSVSTVNWLVWTKKKDLFNIFIVKYLFKRNVQVEPAQWHLGVYLWKKQKHRGHVVRVWRHVWNDNVHIYSRGLSRTEVREKTQLQLKIQWDWRRIKTWIGSIKHILKDNTIKALCFTQINNATDAVVCFVIITRNNSWQMLSFNRPWVFFLNKTDAIYLRAVAVCT